MLYGDNVKGAKWTQTSMFSFLYMHKIEKEHVPRFPSWDASTVVALVSHIAHYCPPQV